MENWAKFLRYLTTESEYVCMSLAKNNMNMNCKNDLTLPQVIIIST